MFNLVANHQWPRITTYLESLKQHFRPHTDSGSVTHMPEASLLAEQVSMIPSLQTQKWEDDHGFWFSIPLGPLQTRRSVLSDELAGIKSNTNCTGETLCKIQESVSELFEDICRLCRPGTTPEHEASLLKKVMSDMFDLWREPRSRFMLKAALRKQCIRQKGQDTLLFLARVCYAAYTFVEIAKVSRAFRSIEIVSVPHCGNQGRPRNQRRRKKEHTVGDEYKTLQDVIKSLDLTFHPGWRDDLVQNAAGFTGLRRSKRKKEFHHAETQLLAYFEYSMSPDDQSQTRRYIGCSRRCCRLCHVLIRAHEHFDVRGTHETLLHRWNVPMSPSTGNGSSSMQLHLAMDRLLMELKVSLQTLFNDSPPRKRT
jgi:OTT_1508-like deaminase